MEDVGETLGSYLRGLRVQRELTMQRTSQLTGITQGYISQIENDIHAPSAKTLAKLAIAYNVSEVELLCRAGVLREATTGAARKSGHAIQSAWGPHLAREVLAGSGKDAEMLSEEMMLPLFDAAGRQLHSVKGLPGGMRLPQHLCGYDQQAFVLEVDDEAMAPLVCRGDWLVVSPATPVYPEDLAVIHDGSRFTLRSYSEDDGVLGFHPSASYFPSWSLEDFENLPLRVVGRALRVINRELRMPAPTRASLQ